MLAKYIMFGAFFLLLLGGGVMLYIILSHAILFQDNNGI
jgi:hypothetical protein